MLYIFSIYIYIYIDVDSCYFLRRGHGPYINLICTYIHILNDLSMQYNAIYVWNLLFLHFLKALGVREIAWI